MSTKKASAARKSKKATPQADDTTQVARDFPRGFVSGFIALGEIMELAERHANRTQNGSALLCLNDARALKANPTDRNLHYARARAIRSLEHSVGMFHEDTKRARGESA